MEEEFEFGSPEEQRVSVDRYEEMLRNEDQYFFDSKAFEDIIDYYITKNDPIKCLEVIEFASAQHPFKISFLIKKAQVLANTFQYEPALQALSKAELLEPSESEINLIRGAIYICLQEIDLAEESFYKGLENSSAKDEVYFQMGELYQLQGKYAKAIHYLKRCLKLNKENQEALYEIAFCYDVL